MKFIDNLMTDVKHALRMLWRSPGFALTAIAALSLGIGANTAIFRAYRQQPSTAFRAFRRFSLLPAAVYSRAFSSVRTLSINSRNFLKFHVVSVRGCMNAALPLISIGTTPSSTVPSFS